MKNILVLDTSTATLATAVIVDGTVTATYNYHRHMRHATNIVAAVDAVLAKSGVSPRDVACIACGVGPGSYTGLRIGHAFVKGFARALDIPVCPFSSLEAIACGIKRRDHTIAVIHDARREKFYCGVYAKDGKRMRVVMPDAVVSFADIETIVRTHPGIVVAGDALLRHRERFERLVGGEYLYASAKWQVKAASMARVIAGRETIAPVSIEQLAPNYMRVSEAEELRGSKVKGSG